MPGRLDHLQINVGKPATSLAFYKDMFSFLGVTIAMEHGPPWETLGVTDGHTTWYFYRTDEDKRDHPYDRDATGLNHISILVERKEDVDRFIEGFMTPHDIAPQWDTPRVRDDYGGNYYQVMFADPEGVAIEVYSKDT
jgi:catechol 2,3-dioxygenase-like lactoylglutathione lyase family enzyme